MNLFELFVKIGLDDQASEKLAKISTNLGQGLKKAAQIGTAAVSVAAAGVASLTKSAVENYAEYEQLVGGVETLFKGSADTVVKYAEGAYESAGLSANQYMTTVTSFSASLLQSLGGDTEKAAKKADVAIRDMADNANKFGSSIDSLQTAYAGFAKGQFMLLDNLKLGYGGTQEEMSRLLADAEKVSGIEYDISSYADIVDAIHVIQTEMGIAGATAEEASTTIEGSVRAASAAWQNLTVDIANENSNASQSIDRFVSSVSVAADNILPRVDIALDGVAKLVNGIVPKLVENVPEYIAKYAPKLIQSGANVLKSLASGIKKNAKIIVNSAKDVVITFVDSLGDLIPDIIEGGVSLLSGIVQAVPEVAVEVFEAMPQIIESICLGLMTGVVEIVKAAVSIFVPIVDQSEVAAQKMRNAFDSIQPFTELVAQYARHTTDLSKALSDTGRTIDEIDTAVNDAEAKITEILKNSFAAQEGLRQQDIANIQRYNDQIRAMTEEKIGIYRDQQLAEYRKLMLEISTMDEVGLAESLGRAQAALDASNAAVEEAYTARLIQIENFHKANETVGSDAYKKELEEAKKHRDEMIAVNEAMYNQVLGAVAGKTEEITAEGLGGFERLGAYVDKIKEYFEKWNLTDFINENDSFLRSIEALDGVTAGYVNALKGLDITAASAFLNTQAAMVNAGMAIDSETASIIDTVLGAFDELPGEMGEYGKEALLELASGLEEQIPELVNAAEMTADEIIQAIRNHFSKNRIVVGINFQRTGTDVDGSHANGLSYVPYDGYIAELHKGERVLTANESKAYSSGNVGDINITINGAKYDSEETLAVAVAEKIQEMFESRGAVYA